MITLYYASGSPYAWRVWLGLEHKNIPYELKMLSFDAGDLKKPQFRALNPRGKVPVIVDDGFALSESAAILEYLDDKWPGMPRLFATDLRQRALQRRLIREADGYFAAAMEHLAEALLFTAKERWSEETIAAACAGLKEELARWETVVGSGYLAGDLSAADFTLYPELALALRIAKRKPGLPSEGLVGPRMAAWVARMESLPIVRKTWPPHWK
ncbi:MAG: glutathione S-transferase family protein [Proteobacteria bacterium]|nr:glutathione S-transferase family protein [Pseudomonadota bacterium]MBI3499288.1 glutathione S-transferase family protein [Pseudomonadota bacterium]